MKLIADDGRTESRRNEAMHFAWPRMSFEGRLREEQLAIKRDLETAAAAGQQQRPGDPRRPRVEELSHQTGGSIGVVSDDAELDLEFVRLVGRLGLHARTLRCDARRHHALTPTTHRLRRERSSAGPTPVEIYDLALVELAPEGVELEPGAIGHPVFPERPAVGLRIRLMARRPRYRLAGHAAG